MRLLKRNLLSWTFAVLLVACGGAGNLPTSSQEPTVANSETPSTSQALVSTEGRIAFKSTRDGNAEVYITRLADALQDIPPTRVTHHDGFDSYIRSWSPDGQWIAFFSEINEAADIVLTNPDDTEERQLTNMPQAYDADPTWSPDSQHIAFISDRDNNNIEIYTTTLAGAEPNRLTHNEGSDVDPAWSPDGKMIAFAYAFGELNWQIYVMQSDGSEQKQLTRAPGYTTKPLWSPDGNYIVFISDRDKENSNAEVYRLNLAEALQSTDGSAEINLTNSPGTDNEAVWSPDGTRIAFVSYRDEFGEIYVMNADGSTQTRLTFTPGYDGQPAWSPDGTRLAFTSNRSGLPEIYVMNADGSAQTRLTHDAGENLNPLWEP